MSIIMATAASALATHIIIPVHFRLTSFAVLLTATAVTMLMACRACSSAVASADGISMKSFTVSLAFPPRLRTLSWPARHLLMPASRHVVRARQAAAREADKVHKQGQSLSVMPSRDRHVDDAHRRITQHIRLEGLASRR
jgi:hypothetical protein